MSKMFEYTNGRFVNASKIVGANIYKKQVGTSEENGQPIHEIRVAIDLDTENRDKSVVYAGPFQNEQEARNFAQTVPIADN
jgi:hypothetical protein